ncbi:prolyl 3-hydroxylase 1 [Polypterus senegalus]|uniref:prolyl 3-hydroxylase 1 n=1 Tax=Polypterus senegalus TaxID=55291 RepID=UPI001964074D|nr:prolyl 3-hydroxylase 1 [Polypterus senegalus]
MATSLADVASVFSLFLFHPPAGLLLQISLAWLVSAGSHMHSSAALLQSYDSLYHDGVRAYFKKDWEKVVTLLEWALQTQDDVSQVRLGCHSGCRLDEIARDADPLVSDLNFFQAVLRRSECLSFCERSRLEPAARAPVSEDVQADFNKRVPYNFLQVAYYKLKKFDKAVSAAHTFFVSNPNHIEMKMNIRSYRKIKGLSEEAFVDREAQGHWLAYDSAILCEEKNDFVGAMQHWEKCVNESLAALNQCRATCEGPYQYGEDEDYLNDLRDLYQKTAAHFLQVLSCRQGCALQVATKPGRLSAYEDFLPSLFRRLYYSAQAAGLLNQAVQAAKTLQLFYPDDKEINESLQQYLQSEGKDDEHTVIAREDVQAFVQQSLEEKRLLFFGVENMGFPFFKDPDTWTPESVVPESLREARRADQAAYGNESEGQTKEEESVFIEGGSIPLQGVVVAQSSEYLNGSNRVVLDGLLNNEECRTLLQLANTAAAAGDGYRGRRSPHTPHENFQGLTLLRAARLSLDGAINQSDIQLYLNATDRVRRLLQSYFNSPTPLYFSFSHLVCRTAITGQQEGRIDLSHPVHADNCLLDAESQECWKEPPAYIHRDLSAILYLNNDFEGGNLIFTARDGKTVTAEVSPHCGRLVAFTSGSQNPHGVRAVTSGQRCAVALWFTLDESRSDEERKEAEQLINELPEEEDSNEKQVPEPPQALGRTVRGRSETKGTRDEL